MSNNISEITRIFDHCIKGTASPSERDLFHDWVVLPENRDEAIKLWENAFENSDGSLDMNDTEGEGIFEAILSVNKDLHISTADLKSAANDLSESPYTVSDDLPAIAPAHHVHFLKTAWFRYAAVLLLVAGTATFLYKKYQPQQETTKNQQPFLQPEIQPGGNKAILTLSDGSTIVLDSRANGQLAVQGDAKILKVDDGALAYHPVASGGKTVYNTISTPRGGQYQVALPDGSRVWLNAASSITFPTSFAGGERRVEVKGEAYLEIVADKFRPFFVKVNDQTEIQVLGTSFNVNVYPDEPVISTTLIEGRLRISAYKNVQTITSGQQAQVGLKQGQINLMKDPKIEQIMAWKNGVFNFDGAKLKQVMQQIERWYDIEVVYEKGIPDITFFGEISRDMSLPSLLNALKVTEVHFRIEGRRLIVMP